MRKLIFLLVSHLLLSFSLHADSTHDWTAKVHELLLPNGMKFLLYERGESPIFSATIRFRAGGLDEDPSKTGIAHFLEHMAFKGTKTIGTRDYEKEKVILDEIEKVGEELAAEYRGKKERSPERVKTLRERLRGLHQEQEKYLVKEELAKKVMANGGNDLNATTSKDMTSYLVSFPSDKLRFWAELESRRIFEPVFREFYEEKDVVLEERRMRVDNDPDGRLYEALLAAAFEVSPYRWPTIGSEAHLLGLTVQDLRDFWGSYYDPSNAVGALVGRFDIQEAKKILQDTFGRVKFHGKGDRPAKKDPLALPQEPSQREERRVTLSLDARPRIFVGYHKPTLPSREDYIFDLINQILGEGRSSRLYRSLVLEKKVVSHVGTSSGVPGARLPNLFMVELDPVEGRSTEEVLKALDAEVERVRREGVTPGELQKARNQLTVGQLWSLKTNDGLASGLSYYETVAGSWRYLADYLREMDQFRPEDIRQVAETYLVPQNRTIAILKPRP